MTDPYAQSETLSSTPLPIGIESPNGSPNRKKGLAAVAAGAAVAVVAAGGVYAYNVLGSSGDYPSAHLPEGAIFYAQSNFDPSAQQKLALNSLVKKFPELKEEDEEAYEALTADAMTSTMLEAAFDHVENFDWAGHRMAIAIYPDDTLGVQDEDSNPQIVALIEVNDAEAAAEALPQILDELNGKNLPTVNPDDFLAGGTSDEVSSAINVTGKVHENKWLVLTDADLEVALAHGGTSLEDSETFESFHDVRGNVMSSWLNLPGVMAAVETAAGDSYSEELEVLRGTEGEITFTLAARSDGLDLRLGAHSVKTVSGGTPPLANPDDVAGLLSSIAYDDAWLSFAFGGLGDALEAAAEEDPESANELASEFGVDFAPEDYRRIFGDTFGLSIGGASQEDLRVKAILKGADRKAWEEHFGVTDTAILEAEAELSQELETEANIEFTEEYLSVTVGGEPEGGSSFEPGQATGKIDLDGLVSLFYSFDGSSSEPPADLGFISFHSEAQESGDGEAVLSWTTRR